MSDIEYWKAKATAAEAERDRLREALKPFAEQAETHNAQFQDEMFIDDYVRAPGEVWVSFARITLGDLRRARAALSTAKERGE